MRKFIQFLIGGLTALTLCSAHAEDVPLPGDYMPAPVKASTTLVERKVPPKDDE